MLSNSWRLLIVDDDTEIGEQLHDYLTGKPSGVDENSLEVSVHADFESAIPFLETQRTDLLILDVRLDREPTPANDEEMGIVVLRAIKSARFIPVIFYTAYPPQVRSLEAHPVIRVVSKTDGLPKLYEVVKEIFMTRIPHINRKLMEHLEGVQRDYMWEFVAQNWASFQNKPALTDLAYTVARRLAVSLSEPGIHNFVAGLDKPLSGLHPIQCYIIPPLPDPELLAGDILTRQEDDREASFWIVVTPSCDLVQKKAERITLARCYMLTKRIEFTAWPKSSNYPQLSGDMKRIVLNRVPRYHFLPGVFDLPDLVVDFQDLLTIHEAERARFERVASLDAPYSSAFVNRFNHYFGRVGTPDLDIPFLEQRLSPDDI